MSMSNPNKDVKPPSTANKQSRRRKNKVVVEQGPVEILRTESPEVQIQLGSVVNDDLFSNSGTFDGNNTIANYLRQSGRVSFTDVLTHTTKYLKKKRRDNHGNKNENGAQDKKVLPLTMNPKNPVVNKDRLNHSVYLDDEEDCQLIIHILRKNAMARTREELLFLQKAFADIKFFMEISFQLDHACLLHLFKKLNIERFSAGQKIFSQGEVGTKFYVIIKGSTFVLVKKDGIVRLEEGEKYDYTCATTERNERLAECLNGEAPNEVKRKEVERYYPDCWIVRTLTQGDSFGEIGLQKIGSRARTATIVCQEETLVGTLSYDDYQATLAKLYERQYNDKINLFERIDAFRHWRRNHISALFLQLEEVKVQRKKVIIRQGEISNYIYFIKTGEIELHKITNSPNEDDISEPLNTFEDREPMLRTQPSKLKKPELVKLGKITIGDYFGVSETLEKIPSLFTATVSSDEVVLLRITRDRFLKFVKDRQTLKNLREHINRRDKWHLDMVEKTMHVNTQFSSKVWLDPKDQPEFFETPSPFTKKVIAINDENVSIVSKFPVQISGLKSAGNSPRVNFAVTRPKTSLPNSPRSVIVVTNTVKDVVKVTQEHLNSKKFFAKNSHTKDFKHGVTYQRNQNKLKKIFERERQEKQQKEKETNERVRPKLRIVSTEQMNHLTAAQTQNNLKDSSVSVSIVLHKRDESLPSSPEKSPLKKERVSSPLLLRERFASLSLQKINGNDILSRRLSTDDFKPGSNPGTPGMRISAFSMQSPNKQYLRVNTQTDGYQKSLNDLPSGSTLSNSFFKKSSTYYTFTHERFNTEDSIDSKHSQSSKRNSLNDINSVRRVSSAQKEFRLSSFNPKMKS